MASGRWVFLGAGAVVAAVASVVAAVALSNGDGSPPRPSDTATRDATATAGAYNATVAAVNERPRAEGTFGPFVVGENLDVWQQAPCELPPPGEGRMPQAVGDADRADPLYPALDPASTWTLEALRCADGRPWGFTAEGVLPVGGKNYSLRIERLAYRGERFAVRVSAPEGTVHTIELDGRPALLVVPPKELAGGPIPPDRVLVVIERTGSVAEPGVALVLQSNAPEDALRALANRLLKE